MSAAISSAFLRDRCPGVVPRVLTIAGSEHRAAALLAGRIDAAPVELSESVQLLAKAPGRFRTLVSFAEELPSLVTTGVQVNRSWAARNPQVVHDYLKALLLTHRRIVDRPDLLVAEARRRLHIDPPLLADVVAAHLRTNAWDVNGRLTDAAVRGSLAFFVRSGSLPTSLTLEQVADLRYLGRALDAIGRR